MEIPSLKALFFAFFSGGFLVFAALVAHDVTSSIDEISMRASENGVVRLVASVLGETKNAETLSTTSGSRSAPRISAEFSTPIVGTPEPTFSDGQTTNDIEEDENIVNFTPVAQDSTQTEFLSDGIVTFEEYQAANSNTIACLDRQGIQHTDPVYNEDRKQFQFEIRNSPGMDNHGMSPYDECWMRYERDVQAAWVSQQSP